MLDRLSLSGALFSSIGGNLILVLCAAWLPTRPLASSRYRRYRVHAGHSHRPAIALFALN